MNNKMDHKLFYNEEGRITPDALLPCDKSVATRFVLPSSADGPAELFLVAKKTVQSTPVLALVVGGTTYHVDTPTTNRACWLRASIDPASLQAGDNILTVPAQPGWCIAHEPASGVPVIRLRLSDEKNNGGDGHEPVLPLYGDPAIEAHREEWLALLPEPLRVLNERWEWCWDVAGFLSSAWTYANEDDGTSYAPWDTRIILRWGRAGHDDRGEKPIVMCVHYAVSFVQLCIAMGVPARAVALTPNLNTPNGHFVAEVWLEEFQSWAMVDANMHLCYKDRDSGRPLAVAELASRGDELQHLAQFGPGWQSHRARFADTVQQDYLAGAVYRLWGVWRRHNWIERRDLAPPAHGAVVYAETDIIWCAEDEATRNELGMFPHFLSADALSVPPI